MITNRTINGISVTIPETSDSAWGDYTTALLLALVDSGIFTGSGSSRPLTVNLNLGDVYGVIAGFFEADYFKSTSANAASSGTLRLANGDVVSWRNAANSPAGSGGDISLSVNSGDRLLFNGALLVTESSVDIFTNKSLSDSTTAIVDNVDNTVKIKFDAAGTTGTSTTILSSQTADKTITLPNATTILVGKDTTDDLSNKTLVAPIISNTIPGSPAKGQMYWDDSNETITVKMAGTDVNLQIGQENYIRAKNATAGTLSNGKVVYVNGVDGQTPTIALAKADAVATSDGVIGIVTEDILAGATGYVTTMGVVRGINTFGLSAGATIYLSPTTAGEFTTTLTGSPDHQVKIGTVLHPDTAINNGSVLVRVEIGQHLVELHDVLLSGLADRDVFEYDLAAGAWKNYINPNTVTKEPTGFADPANVVVTYDSSSRTISLSHTSGSIVYYINGIRYNRTSPYTSSAHDVANGPYFFAFATGNTPTWTSSFPGFDDGAFVAVVNYGATDKFAIRECHGLMPWPVWQELHTVVGTYRDTSAANTGGGVVTGMTGGGTTQAEMQPVVASNKIWDEDLPTTVAGIPTKGAVYTQLHFDTGSAVFTPASSDVFPNNGTNPQYNQNPITGTALTAITSNNTYFNVYGLFVPTTKDAGGVESPYRIIWMLGQTTYGSETLAKAEDFRSLYTGNLTTLFPEFVPYIRLTYYRSTAGTTYVNTKAAGTTSTSPITYLTGSRMALVSVSGFTPTLHSALTGRDVADSHPAAAITNTPSGNLAATDVQGALNELQSDVDGKVAGLGTTIDNRLTKTSGITGTVLEQTGISVDDSNNVSGIVQLTATGVVGQSSSSNLILPSGNTSARGTAVTGSVRYNTQDAQFEGYSGTAWGALGGGGGGGLTVTPLTITTGAVTTPLAAGKHYVINMVGADGNKTTSLPAGSSGANIRVSVVPASSLYKLTITADDAAPDETFIYGGSTGLTSIDFPAGAETWAEFCWNGTSWSVEDATTPISGTFSGDLTVTGDFNNTYKNSVFLYNGNGHGSSGTKMRKFSNSVVNGSSLTYTTSANNSNNGDKIVVNDAGIYAISCTDGYDGGSAAWAITLNDTAGYSTNFNDLSNIESIVLASSHTSGASTYGISMSWTGYLAQNDKIQLHDQGLNNAVALARLVIVKIG